MVPGYFLPNLGWVGFNDANVAVAIIGKSLTVEVSGNGSVVAELPSDEDWMKHLGVPEATYRSAFCGDQGGAGYRVQGKRMLLKDRQSKKYARHRVCSPVSEFRHPGYSLK